MSIGLSYKNATPGNDTQNPISAFEATTSDFRAAAGCRPTIPIGDSHLPIIRPAAPQCRGATRRDMSRSVSSSRFPSPAAAAESAEETMPSAMSERIVPEETRTGRFSAVTHTLRSFSAFSTWETHHLRAAMSIHSGIGLAPPTKSEIRLAKALPRSSAAARTGRDATASISMPILPFTPSSSPMIRRINPTEFLTGRAVTGRPRRPAFIDC